MIIQVDEQPPCRRCGQRLLLTATVPVPDRPTLRPLALCSRCHAHDPAAQGLLAWFAIHDTITAEALPQVQALAAEWVAAAAARPGGISSEQAEADLRAWRRGDYD
jgi:hypothetical protein